MDHIVHGVTKSRTRLSSAFTFTYFKQSLKINVFIIVLLFKVLVFKSRCFFLVVAQGGDNLVKL